MKRPLLRTVGRQYIFAGGILLAVLALEGFAWWIIGGLRFTPFANLVYWALALLLATGLAFLSEKLFQQQKTQKLATPLRAEHESLQKRLDGMVRLNQLLIDAQDEQEMVEKALEIISSVVSSTAASFIPYDEWGQPLKTYVYGPQVSSESQLWATQLTSPAVRDRCRNCNEYHSETGGNCPLLAAPFTDPVRIYCLPLSRNDHTYGIVNLYLPANTEIEPELHDFLVMLLTEMSLAVEMIRLRNQELVTLRQLQSVNGQQEDLTTIIGNLIDGLRDVLDFRNSKALFRAAEPRGTSFEISSNTDPWLDAPEAAAILTRTANQGYSTSPEIHLQPGNDGSTIIVLPFCLPEGTVIGALIMTGGHSSDLQPRQKALIDTVTTQIALLVENERRRVETEYRTVMQERVRLAREIHDSLAQTLAYLKLTSAQMQTQLTQGDLVRLAQNLQNSHDALSEAYLETRQAIDNLRFAPQQDMVSWLGQIIHNFEQTSGLKAVTSVPAVLPQVSPEVQAQLVRIIQETLSNIRKHAQATKVWINVREWNQELLFDLGDDGVGFSAEDVPDLSRHGLRGMRERAELIGAEFQITSQPGRGTTIHIEVPINPQETPV